MTHPNDESPIAFANFAHSYCSSAIALQHSEVDATHSRNVVTYLYYHSIELYLKAFLMTHGMTAKELRHDYRHDVGLLSQKASELGFGNISLQTIETAPRKGVRLHVVEAFQAMALVKGHSCFAPCLRFVFVD